MSVLWWELFPNLKSMCTLRGNNAFILPGMLLYFMKFLYPWGENVISVSPGGIFLNGHMTGQPFNSVNLLVKSRSSQCFQYLTLNLVSNMHFSGTSNQCLLYPCGVTCFLHTLKRRVLATKVQLHRCPLHLTCHLIVLLWHSGLVS